MFSFFNKNSNQSTPNGASKNNSTKIVCPDHSRNAYGNISIDSTKDAIHKWVFKIGKMKNGYTSIGIVEASVNKSYGLFTNTGKGYAYRGDGYVAIPRPGKADHDYIKGKPKYKKGDTITMIYTPSNKTLSYSIDDNPPSVIIDNIKAGQNIRYKMATYLYQPQDSLELISCELNIGGNSNHTDTKEEEKEVTLKTEAEINMDGLQVTDSRCLCRSQCFYY